MGVPCDSDEYTFWRWQKDMIDEIEAGVRREGLWFMQDNKVDMWNKGIGCGHDDLIVYDQTGRVSSYLPSNMTYQTFKGSGEFEERNITYVNQDLLTDEGYSNVRNAVIHAGEWTSDWCKVKYTPGHSNNPFDDVHETLAEEGLLVAFMTVVIICCAVAVGRHFIRNEEANNRRWTKLADDEETALETEQMNFELAKLGIRHDMSKNLEGRVDNVDDDDNDVDDLKEDVFDEW